MKNGIIFIILALISCLYLAQEQSSPPLLPQSLREARKRCWNKGYQSKHPNSDLIECENVAIEKTLSDKVLPQQKRQLQYFLNQRMQIAVQLDRAEITPEQYQLKLSRAVDKFHHQINGQGPQE